MNDIGKGLAVGLTAIAACVVICVLGTQESIIAMGAPCLVAFFAYVIGS